MKNIKACTQGIYLERVRTNFVHLANSKQVIDSFYIDSTSKMGRWIGSLRTTRKTNLSIHLSHTLYEANLTSFRAKVLLEMKVFGHESLCTHPHFNFYAFLSCVLEQIECTLLCQHTKQ